MQFDYLSMTAGWASARIRSRDSNVMLTTSYLSDGPAELIEAVLRLLQGNDAAECVWEEEPGEYLWSFEVDDGSVHLRITGSDFWDNNLELDDEDPRNALVFETFESLDHLATVVADATDRLRQKHGLRIYERQWGYAFPQKTLAAVRLLTSGQR